MTARPTAFISKAYEIVKKQNPDPVPTTNAAPIASTRRTDAGATVSMGTKKKQTTKSSDIRVSGLVNAVAYDVLGGLGKKTGLKI